MPHSSIITDQFVRIDQTPASAGERIVAALIDILVVGFYDFFVAYTVSMFDGAMAGRGAGTALYILLLLLPSVAYPFLMETFNQGRSLGKMALHMRVVKVDGSMPSIGAYLMRWIFLLVDTICGIGLFVIVFNARNQRLGDLAAGTMVIREKDYRRIHVSLDEYDFLTSSYRPVYTQASDLSLEQADLIRRTLGLNSADRPHLLLQLAQKVQTALGVTPREPAPEQFLARLLRDYQWYEWND
jgi:uncharacterized RDD family membrane protein YckC